jgi:hypothetical protein
MVDMTRAVSIFHSGSEFDSFLYAPIVEERNGRMLSVLSALAQLDLDPWTEAAKLARLPTKIATARLVLLFAAIPDEPSGHPDHETIAMRLIELLPRVATSKDRDRDTLLGVGEVFDSRAFILVCVIAVAVALAAQWFMASDASPALVVSTHARSSGAVSAQEPRGLGR